MTGSEAVRAANALTARWAAGWQGGSTVLSGAGVWPLLAALQGGAAGATLAELSAATGLNGGAETPAAAAGPAGGAEAGATGLVGGAEALDGARELWRVLGGAVDARAALGLWWRALLELRADWVAGLPAGSHGSLSGDPGADQARLDQWVTEQTGGLLTRMPVSVTADTMLVLASALTVRTAWAAPFRDQPMNAGGGPWQPLGRLAGLFRSGADLDAVEVLDTAAGPVTALTVAGAGDVDVRLLLGEPDRAPGEVLSAGLGAAGGAGRRGSELPLGVEAPGLRVVEVRSFGRQPQLDVWCVRFEVSGEHDLLARAGLFGLRSAADEKAAEFPGISDMELYVSQAKQDAVATFSATGFEAAAVTGMGMQPMGAPAGTARAVQVTFDRPFGFAAVHRPSGLVLVAGWVAEPERAPAGAF